MSKKFKYQTQIDEVKSQGLCCPPDSLLVPNNHLSFRFVFEDVNHVKNHKPPGINNPKRILKEPDSKKCSLYGLSCFSEEGRAKQFFKKITNSYPNVHKSIGDTLSIGHIQSDNGLMSDEDAETHFDLFEFEDCDLSKLFVHKEKLI